MIIKKDIWDLLFKNLSPEKNNLHLGFNLFPVMVHIVSLTFYLIFFISQTTNMIQKEVLKITKMKII